MLFCLPAVASVCLLLLVECSALARRIAITRRVASSPTNADIKDANKVLDDIRARKKAVHYPGTSKAEYCVNHAYGLQEDLCQARTDLERHQAELDQHKADQSHCGCCCEMYHDIQHTIGNSEQDVKIDQDRISTLINQTKALDAWCSV